MKADITEKIEIPEGIDVKVEKGVINAKGPKGETEQKVNNPLVGIEIKSNKVILKKEKLSRHPKRIANTFTSHINNMIRGVTEGYVYKLRI